MLTPEIVKAHRSQTLDLSQTPLIPEDINEILLALKGHPFIQKVLFQNKTNPEHKKALKNMLKRNKEYENNLVSSLQNLSLNKQDSRYESIQKSHDLIFEHAQRRVDLFFYTLVYYYNTDYQAVSISNFQLQHGRGEGGYTEAAHSALISKPFGIIYTKGTDDRPLQLNVIWPEGSYFFNTLNATIEMPNEVNVFDRLLEGQINHPSRWRQEAINILTRVCQKALTPIQGLECFFKTMYAFFNDPKIKGKYWSADASNEKKLIFEIQYKATFNGRWDQTEVSEDYIAMLLRLNTEGKSRFKADEQYRKDRYKQIYKEISCGTLTKEQSERNERLSLAIYHLEIPRLFHLANYEAALGFYDDKFELMKKYRDIILIAYRGASLYHLKHYEKAIEDFSLALSFTQDMTQRATLYANRGSAYLALGHYQNALNDFCLIAM